MDHCEGLDRISGVGGEGACLKNERGVGPPLAVLWLGLYTSTVGGTQTLWQGRRSCEWGAGSRNPFVEMGFIWMRRVGGLAS